MMTAKRNVSRELLVWGYVREIEMEYKQMNIPFEINDIIYLYQRFCDEWSKRYSNSTLVIDEKEDGNSVCFKNDEISTAFGEHVVEQDVFKWKLKVKRMMDVKYYSGYPFIGIMENNDNNLSEYSADGGWSDCGYQLCAGNNGLWCPTGERGTDGFECKWKKPGDILEIVLDLNERTVRFILNDEDCGVAFKDIKKTHYRLALTCQAVDGSKSEFVLI